MGGQVLMGDDAVDVVAAFQLHRSMLVRLAVMLVDDRGVAEELVQDAFAGLQRHRDEIRVSDAVGGYLRASVLNGARGVLRRRRLTRRLPWVPDPGFAPGADVDLLLSEEHREVFAAVHRLPARQREVVVLRYWAGLSEQEIAQTLNISPGTVKSQASRALKKCRDYLESIR